MAGRQAALLGLVLALGAAGLTACGRRDFRVSGTVTIASSLQGRAPKQNAVLFIVAKNLGGVPLAVKRVVNPQFPVDYALGPEDLVVPGTLPREALRMTAEMNAHGSVGRNERGDILGDYSDPVFTGERRAHIVLDRQL
jgi:hypothetical protein